MVKVSASAKLQRIDLRTTATIKITLAQAAELAGLSVSSFLIEAAYEKAKSLIREQEILRLADVERDRFLILLDRKPKPVAKLKTAMKKYLANSKGK